MKNTTPIFIAIFLGICCLSSSSCTSLFEKMYGVNNVKDLDTSFIARFVREDTLLNHYPEYYLDSGFIVKQDKVFGESQTRHNLLQPIQALYFDSTGTLISWISIAMLVVFPIYTGIDIMFSKASLPLPKLIFRPKSNFSIISIS